MLKIPSFSPVIQYISTKPNPNISVHQPPHIFLFQLKYRTCFSENQILLQELQADMIGELIREAPAGQLIRYLSNNRFLKYPEERSDFVLPPDYQSLLQAKQAPPTLTVPTPVHSTVNLASTLASEDTIAETAPNADRMSEKEATVLKAGRRDYGSMVREKSSDGTILVDWYNKEDPENPQNWSDSKRLVVTLIICFYTFAVYVGSAIYISSEYGVMATFGVSDQKALLPLSLYVLACK